MEKQDFDELGRQLDTWAGAYSNILRKESERSALMLEVMRLDDEIASEARIQDSAKCVVNRIIESIEDGSDDYAEVNLLMQERLAPSIIKGFVR